MRYIERKTVKNIKSSDTHILLCKYSEFNSNKIPNNITHLKFEWDFNQTLDFLPESLKILNIKNNSKITKINDLSSSIKQIIIRKDQLNVINKIYHHKTFLL